MTRTPLHTVKMVPLGEIASFEMGQSPDSRYVSEDKVGIPFLQGNAEFGDVHPQPRLWCRQPKKVCLAADTLISVRAPVGAMNTADQAYCIGRGLAAVRFSGANPGFGKHLLGQFAPLLRLKAQGTTFEAVGKADLATLKVPGFPGNEQARIAEVLDTLDDVIRETKALIAKQSKMKQGYLHDLLTLGIGANGKVRNTVEQGGHFKDSPVGRIPSSWRCLHLQDLTSTIVDGVHHTPTYTETGVPFLTVENLTRGGSISFSPCRFVSMRAHQDYCARVHPEVGDVLVSKDGTLGVARVVPSGVPDFSIFVSIALLRPRSNLIKPELVREFFDTPWFEKQLGWLSAGTGLKHIHLEHFRAFLLPVPPLEEQELIVHALNSFQDSLYQQECLLVELEAIKSGLSADLLTGRVRVPAGAPA